MDRRQFLQTGATTLAASALAQAAGAQAPRPPTAGAAPQAAPAPAAAAPKKLKIDAYSRHLQWLREPNQVAEAVIEMGFDGLDVTVRPYPGHVDPAKVATELPAFVNAIRRNGLQVVQMACPINDASTPHAEAILDAAASLGIHHYWGGNWQYDQTKPIMPQLEALKPRVEKLVALNRKYNSNFMSHTRSGPGTVGNAIWDALHVLREFDPRHVSLHWDAGHSTLAGANNTWALSLRAAGPYVGGISIKDELLELAFENPEGGPFRGTPESLNTRPPRGGPGGPGGPGGVPGGAPRPPVSQAAEQEAAERGVQGPPPAGGVPPRPPGPPGGPRQGQGQGRPAGRGGGGQTNPWRVKYVPLGMGLVNLPLLAEVLKEIDFSGPVEIQAEYPLGGAESAQEKITLPRAMVLGAMKRDRLTLKAAFEPAGLL
jgi:sugar phosphate isomerase/epimerase